MELKDTVTFFSTEVFADAFDLAATFKGKINPFAEVANSGASSKRRILETPVDQVLPTSRVVQAMMSGEKYIAAAKNPDYWQNEEIRYKYSTLPVDVMGSAGDIGDVLSSSQPETELYCYPYFVRRESDQEEQSDHLTGYELYFSSIKSFPHATIVSLGLEFYRLTTDTWIDGAGYAMAQAVKLEDPIKTYDIKLNTGVYDPIEDNYGPATVLGIRCFEEPLRHDYEFSSPSFPDIKPGDRAISLMKADADAKANDSIGPFKVLGVRDGGDWIICQCRNLGEE